MTTQNRSMIATRPSEDLPNGIHLGRLHSTPLSPGAANNYSGNVDQNDGNPNLLKEESTDKSSETKELVKGKK